MTVATDLDQLAIDTIRTLSIDAVQKANSGHPGAPMGAAPMAYVLWTRFLRHAPTRPDWPDRDRFVLSAGHASMLLYSLLHLTGYEVSLEDLQSFRQWGSITPGHPEYGLTPGVEATTGPLGQGFANAVGMAIAERRLALRVQPARPRDRRSPDLCHRLRRRPPGGHRLRGGQPGRPPAPGQARRPLRRQRDPARRADGDGLLRGRPQALRRLRLAHPAGRGRQRPRRHRGGHRGRAGRRPRPSLIAVRTHIGYGSPNKQDSQKAHGSPLGEDEVRLTKEAYGWDPDRTLLRAGCGARPVPRGDPGGRGARRGLGGALLRLPRRRSDGRRRVPPPDQATRAPRRLGRRPQDLRDRDRGRDAERQPGRDPGAGRRASPSCSAAPPTCPNRT